MSSICRSCGKSLPKGVDPHCPYCRHDNDLGDIGSIHCDCPACTFARETASTQLAALVAENPPRNNASNMTYLTGEAVSLTYCLIQTLNGVQGKEDTPPPKTEERKTEEELTAMLTACPVVAGQVFRHHKTGALVSVTGRVLIEETCEVGIIYYHGTLLWVRPVTEFLKSFTQAWNKMGGNDADR